MQAKPVPGFLVNLLRIAAEGSVDEALRKSAAILFKNLVREGWEPSGAIFISVPISLQDPEYCNDRQCGTWRQSGLCRSRKCETLVPSIY